jgi:hypothetical protein
VKKIALMNLPEAGTPTMERPELFSDRELRRKKRKQRGEERRAKRLAKKH